MSKPMHPLLPTLIVATATLRDLTRVARDYPDAIGTAETAHLFDKLQRTFLSAVESAELTEVLDVFPMPALIDSHADVQFASMLSVFLKHHKDFSPSEDLAKQRTIFRTTLSNCLESCEQTVLDVHKQLDRVMHFDCIYPSSPDISDFHEPRRAVQMAERYWRLLRGLLIHHTSASISFEPHPLGLMLRSMRKRFTAIEQLLPKVQSDQSGFDHIDKFIGALITGNPDSLAAEPESTNSGIAECDDFIESLRDQTGIGIFDLTSPETTFCQYTEMAIGDYTNRVDEEWRKISAANAKLGDKLREAPARTSTRGRQQADSTAVSAKDISGTNKLILLAVMELDATDESKKVFAPAIGQSQKLTKLSAHKLRMDLSHLRQLRLLGGQKGSRGYWLTDLGLKRVRAMPAIVPNV